MNLSATNKFRGPIFVKISLIYKHLFYTSFVHIGISVKLQKMFLCKGVNFSIAINDRGLFCEDSSVL